MALSNPLKWTVSGGCVTKNDEPMRKIDWHRISNHQGRWNRPGVVVHTVDPTRRAGREIQVWGQPGLVCTGSSKSASVTVGHSLKEQKQNQK